MPRTTALGKKTMMQSRLTRSVKTVSANVRNVGGVSYIGSQESLAGAPSSFTVNMANASGGALVYIVGDDGTGLAAGAFTTGFAATFTQPSSWNGQSVAAAQASFKDKPVLIDSLNFNVTAAGNLTQTVQYIKGDVNGSGAFIPINLAEGLYPDQYINTRLVLKFANPYKLDGRSAFTFAVPDATTTTVTFGVSAAAGR